MRAGLGLHQVAGGDDAHQRHVLGELGDIGIHRVQHDVGRPADLDHLALAHDGDAVGQAERLEDVVGDEDDGLVQHLLQAQELVLHLPADQGIERRERLVEEPQLRPDGERAGDAHALLLAAGKLVGKRTLAPLQAHQLDHFARAALALALRLALDAQRKGDVVENRQMGQQAEILEHHAHGAPAQLDQLGFARLQQVLAVEQHFAGGGLHQARQAAHHGRLARARQPHDDEDLADMDVEAGVDDGGKMVRRLQLLAQLAALARPRQLAAGPIARRLRTVDLPQVAAGELDRPSLLVHRGSAGECGRPALRSPRSTGLPLGIVDAGPGPRTAPPGPRASRPPRCGRSSPWSRRPDPRPSCRPAASSSAAPPHRR